LRKKDIEAGLLVKMKVGPRKACEYVANGENNFFIMKLRKKINETK